MAVDASVMAPAATDTAAPPEAAPDTGPTPSGDAVERPSDGDAISAPPPPGDQPAEDTGEGTDDDTSDDDAPRSEEEQKLSRSERRRLREQERIDKAIEERWAERERVREAERATAEAEAKAREAQQAYHKRFGDLVGTPEKRAELQAEIHALVSETTSINPEEADWEALQKLNKARLSLAEKQADMRRLEQNERTFNDLREFEFEVTKADYLRLAESLPPEHQKAYLSSQTIPEALQRLEAGLVAREAAKAKAEVAKVEAEWRSRYEKEVAAHAETRTGVPGAGPSTAGGGLSTGGISSREQFLSLPKEQKDKIRREQPDLVAAIYSRSA
jgi:hypothetical protein